VEPAEPEVPTDELVPAAQTKAPEVCDTHAPEVQMKKNVPEYPGGQLTEHLAPAVWSLHGPKSGTVDDVDEAVA